MNRLIVGAALLGALAVPATASADPFSRADAKNAAKHCQALKEASATRSNFRSAVDTVVRTKVTNRNAYGKCVSAHRRDEHAERHAARSNAAKTCQAMTPRPKGRAYGKCVADQRRQNKQESDRQDQNRVNAAQACREEQKDSTQFAADYGTKRNAFGKCVSKKARAQNDEEASQPTA